MLFFSMLRKKWLGFCVFFVVLCFVWCGWGFGCCNVGCGRSVLGFCLVFLRWFGSFLCFCWEILKMGFLCLYVLLFFGL